MDPITFIKRNIAINLEKQGSSIEEFEQALESKDHRKIAELGAKALIDPKDLIEKVTSLPVLGAAGVLGASYVGASALDKLDNKVDENNKGVEKYKEQIKYLKKLTNKINDENSHAH